MSNDVPLRDAAQAPDIAALREEWSDSPRYIDGYETVAGTIVSLLDEVARLRAALAAAHTAPSEDRRIEALAHGRIEALRWAVRGFLSSWADCTPPADLENYLAKDIERMRERSRAAADGTTLPVLLPGEPVPDHAYRPPVDSTWSFDVEEVGGQTPTDYGTGTEDWGEWHWTLRTEGFEDAVLSGVEVEEDPTSVLAGIVATLNGRVETTHASPPDGAAVTPCCGRTPFELPRTDRITLDAALVTCGAAADGTTPTQPDEVLWPLIARIYEQFRDQPTAMQLGRLTEEVGEVWQAYAGVMSANPRKGGVTHCPADVTQELWDVIVTAMVSLHHFDDDPAAAAPDYLEKYQFRLADAGRVVATPATDG